MHVPDHLFNDATELVAAAGAVATLAGVAVHSGRRAAAQAQVSSGTATRPAPLLRHPDRASSQLGTAAAVFALQMVNFPVLPGTSGHLLGGALASALIGPRRALFAVTAVVLSQAVFFGDGGVGAIGVNLWLLAILPVAVAALAQRLITGRVAVGRAIGPMAGALAGPPVAALAFAGLHLLGGIGAAPTDELFTSMVGVHLAIGVGEAVVTAAALAVVAATARRTVGASPAPVWGIAALAAGGLSLLASSQPDGLERVAEDLGLSVGEASSILGEGPLHDYAVAGLDGWLSGSLAGLGGLVLTAAVAAALFAAVKIPGARSAGQEGTGGAALTP